MRDRTQQAEHQLRFSTMQRLFVIMMLCLLVISPVEACAQASSETQDGITVTLTTNKTTYAGENDPVEILLTVENTNTNAISTVDMELILPTGLDLISGQELGQITLNPGERKEYRVAATPEAKQPTTPSSLSPSKTSATPGDLPLPKSPKTGDAFPTYLAVMAALAGLFSLFLLRNRKQWHKFFALFLCVALSLCALPLGQTALAAPEEENAFTVRHTITVDGVEKELTAKITFQNTALYNILTPDSVTDYGATAAVTFSPAGPQPAGTPITVTVTVSNLRPGGYCEVFLESPTAQFLIDEFIDPVTETTQTFTGSFTMPPQDITDFRFYFSICFTGDTLIATSEGNQRIDQIAVGDLVWSWDEASDSYSYQRVTAVHRHENVNKLHAVKVDDRIIQTTWMHPFYVEGKGFVRAGELAPGDRLRDAQGKIVHVTDAYPITLDTPVTVYNLTVENTHTYFAGGVLVHNK